MSGCIECSISTFLAFGAGVLLTAQAMQLAQTFGDPEPSPTEIVASASPSTPFVMGLPGMWPPVGPDGNPVPDAGPRPTLTVSAVCPAPAPAGASARSGEFRQAAAAPIAGNGDARSSGFIPALFTPDELFPGDGLLAVAIQGARGGAEALQVPSNAPPMPKLSLGVPGVPQTPTAVPLVDLGGIPTPVIGATAETPPVSLPGAVWMFGSAILAAAWFQRRKSRRG